MIKRKNKVMKKASRALVAGAFATTIVMEDSLLTGVEEYFYPQPHTEQPIPVSENNVCFGHLATATTSASGSTFAIPLSDGNVEVFEV
jgi:hypothetical protein